MREKTGGRTRLRHPVAGELDLRFERLNPADDAEHRLLAYTADPGSAGAERLALLASWSAGDPRHAGTETAASTRTASK